MKINKTQLTDSLLLDINSAVTSSNNAVILANSAVTSSNSAVTSSNNAVILANSRWVKEEVQTFATISNSMIPRIIFVKIDENNLNESTLYFHDGVGLNWITTQKLY